MYKKQSNENRPDELKTLLHADSILHNNPDVKSILDTEIHDFSFSKDEGDNNTKVFLNNQLCLV